MNTLLVYAHPWEGSYNYSLLNSIKDNITNKGNNIDIIDLYKENFDPVLNIKDLSVYQEGKFTDPLVEKYQKKIEEAEHLIFIFPVWWYDMPAILKGFMDKILLKNWAYDTSSIMPKGKLTFIKKATVITTMKTPNWYYKLVYGNSIKYSFIRGTLKFCGIRNINWFNISNVENIGITKREKWIEKISRHVG